MNKSELINQNLPICTHLTSIDNVKKLMEEKHTQEIIIVDTMLEKHVLGTVHSYNINTQAINQGVNPSQLSIEECMHPLLYSMDIDSTLEECESYLKNNNISEVVILDKNSAICGIFNPDIYHQQNPESSDI